MLYKSTIKIMDLMSEIIAKLKKNYNIEWQNKIT